MLFTKEDLRHLIVPLIIEQLLGVTIGMADTIMVANVGEAAVSGISLVDSLNTLLIQIFSAMATGGAVIASQYLGRQDREHACIAAKQLLYASLAIALGLSLFAFIGGKHLLGWIFGSIEADVMENARIYFILSALSYPFLALYNAGAALFRSMSNSKVSMKISALMNIINVCGNALLIYGFRMGAAGAGLASLLARASAAIIVMLLLCQRQNPIYVAHPFSYRFNGPMIRSILSIGIPNGLENGMFQFGKVLVSSLVAMFGTSAITANAIAGNIVSFEVIPGSAIGLAMVTVIGRCAGAGDYRQARHYTKKLMRMTYLYMGLFCLLFIFLCGPCTRLYNPSPETRSLAVWIVVYHSICSILIWPLSFALPNVLRAASDVRFTMIASVCSMWFCRIFFSYVLALGCGLELKGVWMAMTLDWAVRSVLFVCRYHSGKWEKKAAAHLADKHPQESL